jgi:hypothetical protein
MGVSGQLQDSATLPPSHHRGTASDTHWAEGWVNPRAGEDAVLKRIISCPHLESNRGRPAPSQSLYQLSYAERKEFYGKEFARIFFSVCVILFHIELPGFIGKDGILSQIGNDLIRMLAK